MRTFRIAQGILLFLILYGIVTMAVAALPAFPGAEGFGTDTPGGRGGQVFVVTNLNAEGAGSLRAAIEASGPRIVVFAVSGIIRLPRTLNVNNPYLTIAGQTAPGDGVEVKGELGIKTHDVIIRYMRFRPGHPSAILPPDDRKDTHAINIVDDAYNVVIDHCSLSWGIDEVFSVYGDPHDVTLQWSIVSEGLYNASLAKPDDRGTDDPSDDIEKGHSMGALIGSENGITLHHNLMAHNDQRNPRLKADGTVDVVNNVIYNYAYSAGAATDDKGFLRINYVRNYVKKGTQSRDVAELELGHPTDKSSKGYAVYVEGNIGPHRTSDTQDQRLVVNRDGWNHLTGTRNDAPAINSMTSAQEAYEQVLNGAGAVLPKRDSVDQRIVAEVRTMGGAIITTPSQRPTALGGWPVLAPGTAPADSDSDGMPDSWETEHGLNPRDSSDSRGDWDGDGYTNIEEYVNSVIPGEVKVGAATIPSEGGAFPGERVRFTASYQGRPSADVIREMRFLVSTNLVEEIPQFYGMVTQVRKGVYQASIQPAPKQAFTGAVPLGVGTPKRDGSSLENKYFRFNTGESWVTVDPATGTITVTWDVTFLDAYGAKPAQSVFTYVAGRNGEKDMGKYDPIDNYGWHKRGSWAVWDPASLLRYGYFQEAYLENDSVHTQGRTCPLTTAGAVDFTRCSKWERGDLTYVIDKTTARKFTGYDTYVYVDQKQQGWVSQSLIEQNGVTSWARDCPIIRNSGVNWNACSWRKVDLSGTGLGLWKAYAAYTLTQGTTRSLTQSVIVGDLMNSWYRTCQNSATGAPDWNKCTAWTGPANMSAMKGLDGKKYGGYSSYSTWNGNEIQLIQRLVGADEVTEKSRTCRVVNGRPDWTGCDGKWTTTSLTTQAWAPDTLGKKPAGFTDLGVIYYYPKGETVPVAFEPRV